MDVRSFIASAGAHVKSALSRVRGAAAHRNPIVILAAAITVMVMLMSVVLLRRNDVRIYEDGELISSFNTLKSGADEWLAAAGVTLEDGDRMTVEGSEIFIERAFYVTVAADGERVTVKTASATVKEILELAGVTLGGADKMDAEPGDVVEESAVITINRVAVDTVKESETVDYETVKEETDSLYKGETKVKQQGEKGKIEYTYEVTLVDGEETERKLVKEETVKEPVDKIILVGTKEKPVVKTVKAASAGKGAPDSYKAAYTMRATAYTYGNDGGNRTCTGIRPYKGIVAVDPKVIPLGTKLYIVSTDGKYVYGEAVAGDTGGSIKGDRMDVFLESYAECYAFGRRNVTVYVLG